MVKQLHLTKRSYPLKALATLFLSKPEFCYLKIEPDTATPGVALYQCKACKTVALDRAGLVGHTLKKHLEEYFEKEEVTGDPPTGEFVCVARCGMSGALLGPPNHHSYDGRVREVHDTRFAHMSMDEYRSKIETVRDPELIEKWKEESRKTTVYHSREPAGRGEPLTWSQAEGAFLQKIMPLLVTRKQAVSVPVRMAMEIEDPVLMRLLRSTWERESRSPRSVLFALRAAFRHKHLHLFKAGRGHEFVTSTEPHPLDPDHAIESIREVLTHLQEQPGCTREGLVESLRPGVPLDSPAIAEVLSPFSWLIEKGHIIEFFDGTLSVPLGRRTAGQRTVAAERG